MSQGERLLRTILNNPGEDAPRLVYADWLEEQGHQDLAEFIRVQLQLATPLADAKRLVLEEREADLFQSCEEVLLQPLWDYFDPEACTFLPERGLIAEVTLWGEKGAEEFVRHLPELFLLAPVHTVRLHPVGMLMPSLMPWETKGKLEIDHLNRELLAAILAHDDLTRLRELDLGGSHVENRGGESFAVGNYLGNGGAILVAHASTLRSLRALVLSDNAVSEPGVEALAHSPHLEALEHLDLRFNPLGEDGRTRGRKRWGERVLL